jgi:lipoate synthase
MTFLKQLHGKHQEQVRELLNQELELFNQMMESTERLQKTIRQEKEFLRDVLRNRQTLENLAMKVTIARQKRKMEVER